MRLVLLLLFASFIGYGALHIDKIDPNNYVKMYIAGYTVEIKVLGFILLLIGVVVILYFGLWLIRTLWRSPKQFSRWRSRKNHDKAEQQLGAGYLSLIKGDWRKAESQLLSKSAHSGVPYVNYLAAAQAAQQMGKQDKRDEYLTKAYQAAPAERLAIGLTKAKLHQQAGQIEQALATLDDVKELGAKNPQFTAMLLQTHEQMQNWQSALPLLPLAKKQKALPDEMLAQIESNIYMHNLQSADDLDQTWNNLPREQKKALANVEVYTENLAKSGQDAAAEKLIRSTLKQVWSDKLVRVYGGLQSHKPLKMLRVVEGWLLARPESAELNLAAGRLAVAGKNLDVGKEYLQKAISLGQLPIAYDLLGKLYEGEDENSKALQLYRAGISALSQQGVAAETSEQPSLPMTN